MKGTARTRTTGAAWWVTRRAVRPEPGNPSKHPATPITVNRF
jgi:hypothetical protein